MYQQRIDMNDNIFNTEKDGDFIKQTGSDTATLKTVLLRAKYVPITSDADRCLFFTCSSKDHACGL